MVRLGDAGNTWNPALLALRSKGYSLRLEKSDDGTTEVWWAEKGHDVFGANDPIRLLGLVALWEMRGEKWQQHSDEPDLTTELYNRRDE
jgi:hypothetical protein